MPAGVGNAYWFQIFNTMSYSIVLGTPVLLYFKFLNASATVIGIVAALPPLLNILQIPAARFVEIVGYRAFVLRGWSLRAVFVVGLAGVAVLPAKIDETTKVALMLSLLFAYNTSRGVSVCGFLPWITQWIPEDVRGRYISRDQLCGAVASVATMVVTAGYLRRHDAESAFAVVFGASFVAAIVSLLFLRRIPDVPPPSRGNGTGRVPWREMALYPPFLRLLIYNVLAFLPLAGGGVFWVPCLRDQFRMTDAQILVIGALTPVVSATCLFPLGKLVDRTGSRPVLALANVTLAGHFAAWAMLSARLLPVTVGTIIMLQALSGLGLAALNLANQRLAMSVVPAMGRSHFFALFSVVNGLTLGVFPVLWGIALDSLTGWSTGYWNQFSVLYVALAGLSLVALAYHWQLTEPRAITTEQFFRELFVDTPARAITRLVARRPFS